MAKESMKARERKRERMVARYAKKREQLTKVLKSTSTDEDVVKQKKCTNEELFLTHVLQYRVFLSNNILNFLRAL